MLQPFMLVLFYDPILVKSFVWLTRRTLQGHFCWKRVQNPAYTFLGSPASKGTFEIAVTVLSESFQDLGYLARTPEQL